MPSSVMTSYKKLDKPVGQPANKTSKRITEGGLGQTRKLNHYHKLGGVSEEAERLAHPGPSGLHPGLSRLLPGEPMHSPNKKPSSRFSLPASGRPSSHVSSFDSPSKCRTEPVEDVLFNLASISLSPSNHKTVGLPTVAEEWSALDGCGSKKVDIPDVPRSCKSSRSSRGSDNKRSSVDDFYHLAASDIDTSQDESSFCDQDLCEMSWDFEDDHGVFANGGSDVTAVAGAAAPINGYNHDPVGNTSKSVPKKKKVPTATLR